MELLDYRHVGVQVALFHEVRPELVEQVLLLLESWHPLRPQLVDHRVLDLSDVTLLLLLQQLLLTLVFLAADIGVPKALPLELVVLHLVLELSLPVREHTFERPRKLGLLGGLVEDILQNLPDPSNTCTIPGLL